MMCPLATDSLEMRADSKRRCLLQTSVGVSRLLWFRALALACVTILLACSCSGGYMPLYNQIEESCGGAASCRVSMSEITPHAWDRAVFILARQSPSRVRAETGLERLPVPDIDATVVFMEGDRTVDIQVVPSFPEKPGGWAFVDYSYMRARGWYSMDATLSEVEVFKSTTFGEPIWLIEPVDYCE